MHRHLANERASVDTLIFEAESAKNLALATRGPRTALRSTLSVRVWSGREGALEARLFKAIHSLSPTPVRERLSRVAEAQAVSLVSECPRGTSAGRCK